MRIALIDTTPKAQLYPVSLLKLAAWRKDKGDSCKIFSDLLPKAGEYDEIWLTTCFTFHLPNAIALAKEALKRCNKVVVGGVSATLQPYHFEKIKGVEVFIGLHPEAEKYAPDYSMLRHKPEYSIAYTSRGCVRKCEFCMVKSLEPKFYVKQDWARDIHPETTTVLFYDNNWLAKKNDILQKDAEVLQGLLESGKIKKIDFNQGLDTRLLTEKKADIMKGLPIDPIRFAFDSMSADGHFQRAVQMMYERGFRNFRSYVLFNHNDTPEDLYYRIREHARLAEELRIKCEAFPMCFHPIMSTNIDRNYVGEHWTKQKKDGFRNLKSAHSGPAGTISCDYLGEFEYWFGKNEKEFVKLISYPKINQLAQRKKGKLKQMRTRGECPWLIC